MLVGKIGGSDAFLRVYVKTRVGSSPEGGLRRSIRRRFKVVAIVRENSTKVSVFLRLRRW